MVGWCPVASREALLAVEMSTARLPSEGVKLNEIPPQLNLAVVAITFL